MGRPEAARIPGTALLRSLPVADPQRCTVDVFLLLARQDHVLLALRQGTGFADGMWNLPSGKAESTENAVAAVIREAREELGIRLSERELNFAATVHCRQHHHALQRTRRLALSAQGPFRQHRLVNPPASARPS